MKILPSLFFISDNSKRDLFVSKQNSSSRRRGMDPAPQCRLHADGGPVSPYAVCFRLMGLVLFMAAFLCPGAFPALAFDGSGTADDPWQIGKDNPYAVTAYLSGDTDKTLYIGGSGDMCDFTDSDEVPWKDAKGSIKSVEFGSGSNVTSIGDHAFQGCTGIEILILPPGILEVGENAFDGIGGTVYAYTRNGLVLSNIPANGRLYSRVTITSPEYGSITADEGELGNLNENYKGYYFYDQNKSETVKLNVEPRDGKCLQVSIKRSTGTDPADGDVSCDSGGCEFTMPPYDVTVYGEEVFSIIVPGLTYTGSDQSITFTVKDGETELDADDYAVVFNQEDQTGVTPINAGTYTAILAGKGDYISIKGQADFSIQKADVMPTVTMDKDNYSYGGSVLKPALADGGNPGGGDVKFYYSRENSSSGGTEWKDITGTTLPAGTYYMYAVVSETANYKKGVSAPKKFNVDPVDGVVVTVIGTHDVSGYDGKVHTVEGYEAEISNSLYKESDFIFSGTKKAERKDAGTTNMDLSESRFTNMNPNFRTVTFKITDGYQTITPKAVTVTAEDKSKTEGKKDPELTAKVGGTIGTDKVAYRLSRETGEKPGTYTIMVIAEQEQGNYMVTTVDGKFTITDKKSFLVRFDPNGGTGTMADQVFTVDSAQALTANSFTREGCSFRNWNTAKDGSGSAYKDKQSVKDLTSAGETVTLYAQWTKAEPGPGPEPEGRHRFPIPLSDELPKTGFSALRPSPVSPGPLSVNYRPTGLLLQIPSLDIAASVVTVPCINGEYPVEWLGMEAGMLEGSAAPGEGYTVLTGHNHLNALEAGPFALLSFLSEGDKIFVLDQSGELKPFTVYDRQKIAADDIEALVQIAMRFADTLTLITCEDEQIEGGYASRLVVSAKPGS